MNKMLTSLRATLISGRDAILVSVGETRGSVPRLAGTSMLIPSAGVSGVANSQAALIGTIGGGQLEHRAIAIARELLSVAAPVEKAGPHWVRFPLGPSVGQCCGGIVSLCFERVTPDCLPWVHRALSLCRSQTPWVRIAPMDQACSASYLVGAGDTLSGLTEQQSNAANDLLARTESTALRLTERGVGSYFQSFVPPPMRIALFGAGHVGRAIVNTFAALPLTVIWIDEREDEFSTTIPDNVRAICNDAPLGEVSAMAAQTLYLVLTHSHALDFDLVRAILDRGDARFLGLIGSRSKRISFEQRLRQRGYTDTQLAQVHCPIGIAGIVGKEPEVIALAVAAQMMQLTRQTRSVAKGKRNVG